MAASPSEIAALIASIQARSNAGSDEAKIAFGSGSDVEDPLINDVVIPGTFPRGAGIGTDVNGSKAMRAFAEGVADYVPPIPSKVIVFAYLDAGTILAKFDGTGLGLDEFSPFAICNGNNGTPDLSNRFLRAVTGAAGAIGGVDSQTTGAPSAVAGRQGGASNTPTDTHTHSFDNRPAFFELTALMKL